MAAAAVWTGRPLREIADLSEAEHSATIDALNERIRAESWSQTTELVARCVDYLGAILAQLQAGILTADPKSPRGFGKADFPAPVERPSWIREAAGEDESGETIVSPGELARMFAEST